MPVLAADRVLPRSLRIWVLNIVLFESRRKAGSNLESLPSSSNMWDAQSYHLYFDVDHWGNHPTRL